MVLSLRLVSGWSVFEERGLRRDWMIDWNLSTGAEEVDGPRCWRDDADGRAG